MSVDVPLWLTATLIFCRAGAFMWLVPVFNAPAIPVRARLALALGISVMLAPIVGVSEGLPGSWVELVFAVLLEVLAGGLMGLSVVLLFAITGLAGHAIATEIGLAMARALNPLDEQQETLVQNLLFYFGVLLFFLSGLHHAVLESFAASLRAVPVASTWLRPESLEGILRASASIFVAGLQIAAPFMGVIFLVNLSFAVLGKVAPNVNVFMISFAIRTAVGFLIFLVVSGVIVQLFMAYAKQTPEQMLQFLIP